MTSAGPPSPAPRASARCRATFASLSNVVGVGGTVPREIAARACDTLTTAPADIGSASAIQHELGETPLRQTKRSSTAP